MPVEHAVWKIGKPPQPLRVAKLESEQLLEDLIESDPGILSDEWMLIGRQIPTPYSGRIDLLAITPDGTLILIELKRDKTPRDVVAQALDYASWVQDLKPAQIARIYENYSNGGVLNEDFLRRFGNTLEDDNLNQSHQIIICASEIDHASERIVGYLHGRKVPVNVLFFKVFELDGQQLLSRSWLIDPTETQSNSSTSSSSRGEQEPWNGEFYGSFGEGMGRSWNEARKHGFFSAGGGAWYSRTLSMLSPGDRIWVRIPKQGYVGVGRVTSYSTPISEFEIRTGPGMKPCMEVLNGATYHREFADDEDKAEYFVGVDWLDTLPVEDAFHEAGLFGQQNSVCKPTAASWRHTVERLKKVFPHWDAHEKRADTAA